MSGSKGHGQGHGGSVRRLLRGVEASLRGHDLLLATAGLTFYASLALVPLLLISWWLAGLVLGHDVVLARTWQLAARTPEEVGLADAVTWLGREGARLRPSAVVAALIAATTWGEGLVRSFDRLGEQERRAKVLRGRALLLLVILALPVVVAAGLAAAGLLEELLGADAPSALVAYALFWGLWIGSSALLAVIYAVFSPRRPPAAALAWASTGAGSFLAGMTLAWLGVAALDLDLGRAFGGADALGAMALAGVYLYLVQLVVLVGYVTALVLSPGEEPAPRRRSRPAGAPQRSR